MANEALVKASVHADQRKSPSRLWQEIKKNRWAYVFIAPFYILFLIFGVFPIGFSLFLSFHKWNGVAPIEFIGLKNFEYLLGAGGKIFWQSIQNGIFIFILYVPIMIFVALVLAVILNSGKVRFFRLYRTLIFIPYITSMIAAGITFRLLLEDAGLFNQVLGSFGLAPVSWLQTAWGARVSLSLLVIWGWLGYNMVLMLAGLQTIPSELIDAARIDGAGQVKAFFYITVPLMRPIILFSFVLSTIGTFNLFNEVVAITGGGSGPQRSLLTPLVQVYNVAFADFQYGRASAQAYVYFILIFVLTLFQLRYFRANKD
jgi:ABC-type sugar transport system permease subunit